MQISGKSQKATEDECFDAFFFRRRCQSVVATTGSSGRLRVAALRETLSLVAHRPRLHRSDGGFALQSVHVADVPRHTAHADAAALRLAVVLAVRAALGVHHR